MLQTNKTLISHLAAPCGDGHCANGHGATLSFASDAAKIPVCVGRVERCPHTLQEKGGGRRKEEAPGQGDVCACVSLLPPSPLKSPESLSILSLCGPDLAVNQDEGKNIFRGKPKHPVSSPITRVTRVARGKPGCPHISFPALGPSTPEGTEPQGRGSVEKVAFEVLQCCVCSSPVFHVTSGPHLGQVQEAGRP